MQIKAILDAIELLEKLDIELLHDDEPHSLDGRYAVEGALIYLKGLLPDV